MEELESTRDMLERMNGLTFYPIHPVLVPEKGCRSNAHRLLFLYKIEDEN
jgi:hypothetical protein